MAKLENAISNAGKSLDLSDVTSAKQGSRRYWYHVAGEAGYILNVNDAVEFLSWRHDLRLAQAGLPTRPCMPLSLTDVRRSAGHHVMLVIMSSRQCNTCSAWLHA